MTDIAAAVAVITAGRAHDVLLLRRADNPRDAWSGQWAFPGGRRDETDADLIACSRRECYEESAISLPPQPTAILPTAWAGRSMGKSIEVAIFHWHLDDKPQIRLDTTEMQASTWLARAVFTDVHCHGEQAFSVEQPTQLYPYMQLDGHPLWGFSYDVLCAFYKIGGLR